MEPQPGRPWYRLHWLTIIVVAWLIWGIARWQFAAHNVPAAVDPTGFESDSSFGWPLRHVEMSYIYLGTFNYAPKRIWNVRAVLINCLTWPMLVISTAIVLERWFRARS